MTIDSTQLEIFDGATALEAISRAEADVQITTAKQYPMHSDARGIKRFCDEAIVMATSDREIAESCLYTLPRGGKSLQGRSVRLAEIVASAWGNIRVQSRITSIDATMVTVEAVAHDLEKNYAVKTEVKRRITDKNGKRYNDDMITVTSNAAASIAIRNAIFKVVPAALTEPVYRAARQHAIGDASDVSTRRVKALQKFSLMGVDEPRVLAFLGRPDTSEITADDIAELLGAYNTIRGGEAQIDDLFPPADTGAKGNAALKEKMKMRAATPEKSKPEEATPQPASDNNDLPFEAQADAQN